MFRGTIVLHNGTTAHVECDTAEQLVDVLSSYEIRAGKAFTPQSQVVHSERAVSPKVKTPKAVVQAGGWSQNDIMLAARKLIETGAKYGTIQEVVKYVAKNGEKKRTESAVYPMVNRLKRYIFQGKIRGGLTKHAIETLKTNGITPNSSVQQKKATGRTIVHWSDRDVVEIGKIVRENVNLEKGLTNLVMGYVKSKGDVKTRTDATLYSITSDIKHYLKNNDTSRITDKMKAALDGAGVTPVRTGFFSGFGRSKSPQEA